MRSDRRAGTPPAPTPARDQPDPQATTLAAPWRLPRLHRTGHPARLSCLGAALLLAGCTSVGELRDKPPEFVLESSKPSKQVAGCISDAWEGAGIVLTPTVTVKPTDKGFSVQVRSEHLGVRVLADVDDRETGSSTRFFLGSMPFGDRFADAVRNCQN
jgi:hypothetical protein